MSDLRYSVWCCCLFLIGTAVLIMHDILPIPMWFLTYLACQTALYWRCIIKECNRTQRLTSYGFSFALCFACIVITYYSKH